jgi:predicted  nucleic acid-binding Zn-ribbon protein
MNNMNDIVERLRVQLAAATTTLAENSEELNVLWKDLNFWRDEAKRMLAVIKRLEKERDHPHSLSELLSNDITVRLDYWAQNEEMVDEGFTEHGHDCMEAVDEIKRLRERCSPLQTVLIGDRVHYVSEPVYAEIKRLRADNERLQKAHDHQYEMAGLTLREAERYSAEIDLLRARLAEAELLLKQFLPHRSLSTWDLCEKADTFLKDSSK